MKIEMTFNDAAVAANGYAKSAIYGTVKNAFSKKKLRCTSDNDVLSFEDTGHEEDFAHLWNVVLSLLKSDWFVKCASSCVFFDDDNTQEDVLSQSAEIRRMLA